MKNMKNNDNETIQNISCEVCTKIKVEVNNRLTHSSITHTHKMSTRNLGDNVGADSGGRSATSSALMNQPIVMDVGTSTTKAGFAGGAKPKVSL